MFEDLNWKWAARRAAVVIAIYLALLYVLSRLYPETFGLQSEAQVVSLFMNAAFFFVIFTFIYAYVERSRRRRLARNQNQQRRSKPADEGSPEDAGPLKGRPNPNTSRKKARRRR